VGDGRSEDEDNLEISKRVNDWFPRRGRGFTDFVTPVSIGR
jgi:hypothetical protein